MCTPPHGDVAGIYITASAKTMPNIRTLCLTNPPHAIYYSMLLTISGYVSFGKHIGCALVSIRSPLTDVFLDG